ncbi:MAG: hypothetical protein GTN53_18155 [Candidatus Aminicenantes bacterium]|nr:hypothetical protein [Candidatus Aminicenantes bacterium]NIN19587.1 hypothetical protein [Candidatus Aminicenantes bacterium]NIQ68378.1 hypothetical protein [Candidatus Aminicenantes bacterium]NIT24421.1 hypothetical protein [Candidatus Aminicenantes bacterium]
MRLKKAFRFITLSSFSIRLYFSANKKVFQEERENQLAVGSWQLAKEETKKRRKDENYKSQITNPSLETEYRLSQ